MNESVYRIFSVLEKTDHPLRIKLLGDSITHGVGGTGWEENGEPITAGFRRSPNSYCWAKLFAEYLEKNYPCTVVNNACTGTTIEFVLEHFDELVEPADDLVLCMIGTNNRHQYYCDAPMKTPDQVREAFYANILSLNECFRTAGKPVVFMASTPASQKNEQSTPEYARLIHMNDINALYERASREAGFPLISLYNRFRESLAETGVATEELLCDGLHPNDRGYELIFRLIVREIGLKAPIQA